MLRIILILGLCFPVFGAEWYVSPSATGNGTSGNPGSLLVACLHTNWAAAIGPGDTIYLKSGVYSNSLVAPPDNINGSWSSTNWNWSRWPVSFGGAAGNYITWRSAPDEWAKVDGAWKFDAGSASYHRFRDLEFYQSSKANQTNVSGIFQTNRMGLFSSDNLTVSNEFINCVIHDCGNVWDGRAAGRSVRGCIIWYAGSTSLEHVFYSDHYEVFGNIIGWAAGQNVQGSSDHSIIASNIMFSPGISCRVPFRQLSSGAGADLSGNFMYGQGSGNTGLTLDLTTGTTINIANNFIIAQTPLYFSAGGNGSIVLRGNTFGATGIMLNRDNGETGGWTVDSNRYYGVAANNVVFDDAHSTKNFTQWKQAYPSYDANSTSANSSLPPDTVMVVANRDEAKRAHIAIYNSSNNQNVSVSLAGILSAGDNYQLYSAQNYLHGPIQTGVYNGTNISVPMTNLTSAPILYTWQGIVAGTNYSSLTQPNVTTPQFGAFVVKGSAAIGNSMRPPTLLRVVSSP